MSDIKDLSSVLSSDLCIGCGACVVNTNNPINLTQEGFYKPDLSEEVNQSQSCPFLDSSLNEDQLSDKFHNCDQHRYGLGQYYSLYSGHVTDKDIRSNASSGGLATWLTSTLVKEGVVNKIIHVVKTNSPEHPYFKYAINSSVSSILEAGGSKYYPVNFKDVIDEVLADNTSDLYCFVGIPCFVKALRLLQLEHPVLRRKIPLTISLVCGHIKSTLWTEMLAWKAGIGNGELYSFKHRTKIDSPDFRIKDYIYTASSTSLKTSIVNAANVPGGRYNSCSFMANACNYCDDVLGETADISLGDAWLPRYEIDQRGNNIIVCRNKLFEQLLVDGQFRNELDISECSPEDILWSQAGGFRQRGEGLAFRLHMLDKCGLPRPLKRVMPSSSIPLLRKLIYILRYKMSRYSIKSYLKAKSANKLRIYLDSMSLPIFALRALEISSSLNRIILRRIGWFIAHRTKR